MKRLIGAGSLVLVLAITYASSGLVTETKAAHLGDPDLVSVGHTIFRFDTFGDEQLWTNVLRMHEVLPTVSPATALAVGLKVDVEPFRRRSSRP